MDSFVVRPYEVQARDGFRDLCGGMMRGGGGGKNHHHYGHARDGLGRGGHAKDRVLGAVTARARSQIYKYCIGPIQKMYSCSCQTRVLQTVLMMQA